MKAVDNEDDVREALRGGATVDQAAQLLINDLNLDPIPAIKALRNGAGIGLSEAKEIVHRNLPVQDQRRAESLWDVIEGALKADPD
jgi:ribosomal protein L7/L12